jgi:hypothetical protein
LDTQSSMKKMCTFFGTLQPSKPLIARDVSWLNKIYSDHMDITKVNFMTTEVEEEKGGEEKEQNE